MNLKVGIVGLPNAGKSTLFNALLRQQLAKVADYPFTTIEPHEGVIAIPDSRLVDLTLLVKPETSTPASVTFVDIAGLMKGAHRGEGLGNEFLGYIREVSAIILLARAFENENAPHPLGSVDPARDVEIVTTELLLKDIETLDKALERETSAAVRDVLSTLRRELDRGTPARRVGLSGHESASVPPLNLLTGKPVILVANINERDLVSGRPQELERQGFVVICASLEAEIFSLPPFERQQYLREMRVSESGLEKVLKKSYHLLSLVTFFTIKGGREVRAWPVRQGTTSIEAAGRVHTDFALRFIKAEVIGIRELLEAGGWQKAHEQGKVRIEGRGYTVADGDVIEFKVGN